LSNAILFVTGASGSGKTAAIERLKRQDKWRDCCHIFDSVGVPSESQLEALELDGESWQRNTISHWIKTLKGMTSPMSILEGQMRPSWIQEILSDQSIARASILLLDCGDTVRERRLVHFRNQPELATRDMYKWAAYLRGQADALELPVLDTSELTLDDIAQQIAVRALSLGRIETRNSDEEQLFEIFYQSQKRQKVELDKTDMDDHAFRNSVRKHFDMWRSNPDADWIIIERNNKPVGFAVTDFDSQTRGFGIGNFGVHEDWRRSGVGVELMRMVITKAESIGATSIDLTVHRENVEARALYEKSGFALEDSDYLDMRYTIALSTEQPLSI